MNEELRGCLLILLFVALICALTIGTCRGEWRKNGAFEEQCVARGGYWLKDSIQVHDTLTRCIEQPKPIMIVPRAEKP